MEIGRSGYVDKYIEKPILKYNISAGIYVFNERVLRYVKKNEHLDLPDLITRLIKNGEKVKTYSYDGLWFDIGSPSDYEAAIKIFETKKKDFLL